MYLLWNIVIIVLFRIVSSQIHAKLCKYSCFDSREQFALINIFYSKALKKTGFKLNTIIQWDKINKYVQTFTAFHV